MKIQDLGVQSWCYRHFKTVADLITQLKKTGVSGVELCGIHFDMSKPETWPGVVKQFKDAGIRIQSIGVQGLNGDAAKMKPNFEFLKATGSKYMSVSFSPDGMWDSFKAAEKLAEQYDVYLGIHNHGGYDWLGNTTILDYVYRHTGPRIGLCLDTAWALDAKQDPNAMAEKFKDRLHGIHIKDFIFDKARNPEDVVVGTGNLKLKEFLAIVQKNGFKGSCVLEYEGSVENPVPALVGCVEAVKKAL